MDIRHCQLIEFSTNFWILSTNWFGMKVRTIAKLELVFKPRQLNWIWTFTWSICEPERCCPTAKMLYRPLLSLYGYIVSVSTIVFNVWDLKIRLKSSLLVFRGSFPHYLAIWTFSEAMASVLIGFFLIISTRKFFQLPSLRFLIDRSRTSHRHCRSTRWTFTLSSLSHE